MVSRILRTVTIAAVGAVVAVGLAPMAHADEGPLPLNPPAWTQLHDGAGKYPQVSATYSVPITMDDGTVLRANVFRPADKNGRPAQEQLPAIVNITPYNKLLTSIADIALNIPTLTPVLLEFVNSLNFSGTPISNIRELQNVLRGGAAGSFGVDRKLIAAGYTQVVVETRGTGTSQGTWQVLGEREQLDTPQVLNWVRDQPWSNGRLGMSGISYSAINQYQAASRGVEGLDAVVPVEPMTDFVSDIVAPGGGLGLGFISLWLANVNLLNKVPDLPGLFLRGELDMTWLRDRINDPAVFVPDVIQGVLSDNPTAQGVRDLFDSSSARRADFITDMSAVKTPTLAVGGWRDIFQNAEWRTLDQLSGLPSSQKKLFMGQGHHVTPGSDFGGAGQPPRVDVLQRIWFDKWLKDIDNGIDGYANVTSHPMGGGWQQYESFPRPGQDYQRMYLTSARSNTGGHAVKDGSLSPTPPTRSATWQIGPGLSTICSSDSGRDTAGVIFLIDACGNDNRIAESNALTFTSTPVDKYTAVSGPLAVRLRVEATAADGFYTTVVTAVDGNGRSRQLSTGNMAISMRDQLVPEKSGYAANGDVTDPYYEFDAGTRKPVKAGQRFTLDVANLATDAVLAPGERIRVSVYALNFTRAVPLGVISHDSELKPVRVVIDPAYPSWLSLPSGSPIFDS